MRLSAAKPATEKESKPAWKDAVATRTAAADATKSITKEKVATISVTSTCRGVYALTVGKGSPHRPRW